MILFYNEMTHIRDLQPSFGVLKDRHLSELFELPSSDEL